ncbi:MAG TPA: hypothetical protein VMU84_17270 [Thermoanaerobaculia bacterium]|nr:hypothetical protein [Thermoanaerobaculia bacterium]
MNLTIRQQVELACRHLLSAVNRDPYSNTYGCFDRRYWAWKLADFPEATFQRNAAALTWLAMQPGESPEPLHTIAHAALRFAARVQHRDGSFDQAFPMERSYAATAFLLHPLLQTYRALPERIRAQDELESMLRRAADFLCRADETHGCISNHVAGAVLALYDAFEMFGESRYKARAHELLDRVLSWQHAEGWFVEYEGADPGYQTLCLYYLAQIYDREKSDRLKQSIARSLEFLSFFAHPDGTFGGEYGSRRTSILYPGGLAILRDEFPVARALLVFAVRSIESGTTVTLRDVDFGNLAPLLSNYIVVIDRNADSAGDSRLPCDEEAFTRDFPAAGLFVRSSARYYAVIGASNGGVTRVFDKNERRSLWNDAGYVGELANGRRITTQATNLRTSAEAEERRITFTVPFRYLDEPPMTPGRNLMLRMLNLTFMRSARIGEMIKKLLVRLLITGRATAPLSLTRTIRFGDRITIEDRIALTSDVTVRRLECGRRFVSIHMASARYYEGSHFEKPHRVDVERLNRERQVTTVIEP